MFRRFARMAIAVPFLAAIFLSACTATLPQPARDTSTDPLTLRFTVWTSNEGHLAMLNEIATAFKAIRPNVSVDFVSIPFGDYSSKVPVQLAGGTPPDAGWLPESLSASWRDAGVLADLGPALQAEEYDFADFSPAALRLWQTGDVVNGIPFSNSPAFIAFNRDLFEAAGVETPADLLADGSWTWDNLARISRELTANSPAGTYGYAYQDLYKNLHWAGLSPVLWAYGGDAWNADGTECLLSTPESVQAVQLIHDMIFVDQSMVPPGSDAVFASGKVGMAINILSSLGQLKDVPFQWDVVPLPSGPAGNTPYIGQAAIVVFEKSQHKDVAADFVAYMTNQDNVAKFAQFFPPARISVLESGALMAANPMVTENVNAVITDGIQKGRTLPTHKEFPKIDLAAKAEFDKLWQADADVQAILTGVCAAIEPYLNQ